MTYKFYSKGVIFEGHLGLFFVSDEQPLVYRWNSRRKWWEYIPSDQVNKKITEDYVREVHAGRWWNATVRHELLCSGIQYKRPRVRRFA